MSGGRFVNVLERPEADELIAMAEAARDVAELRAVMVELIRRVAGDKRVYQLPPAQRRGQS